MLHVGLFIGWTYSRYYNPAIKASTRVRHGTDMPLTPSFNGITVDCALLCSFCFWSVTSTETQTGFLDVPSGIDVHVPICYRPSVVNTPALL